MEPNASSVVGIVGLGYVGLPLALEFGALFRTVGYDSSKKKIAEYLECKDPTGEIPRESFEKAKNLTFTNDASHLATANFIIVAVPTPVTTANVPDLNPLKAACFEISKHMRRGTIVIFESTVYPGATEEVCIPILEQNSNMRWRNDFHVGYSPERINPGDTQHSLTKVVKVVSGDTPSTLRKIGSLYESIVKPGVFHASSIKVAEAAKVIENTQRDLNIALVNELAIIFNALGIDTNEILEAAGTKWNFLKFKPGLVGGHCISVDPYYLTYKAESIGYHPQVILSGRRINDGMGKYIAEQTVKLMIKIGLNVKSSKVNILGLTFKENCSDTRNSKVLDLIDELKTYGVDTYVHDPLALRLDTLEEHKIDLYSWDDLPQADVIILAVSHSVFLASPQDKLLSKVKAKGAIVDVKACLPLSFLKASQREYWRL